MIIDRISFLPANENDIDRLLSNMPASERAEALEIINYYLSIDDGSSSFAFAFSSGALLVRVFNGAEYFFAFPHLVSEKSDMGSAIEECVRYAALEEIEPVFAGVPSDEVGVFFALGYRHINADSGSPESDTYRITIKNECAFVEEYPNASDSSLSLSSFRDTDKTDYARLCRDEENNKYWGYDFREDYDGCADVFFLELAAREFALSSALSFAIRAENTFVGEALLSCFDFKGGADISIRILPEHQKKGYAKRALSLLLTIAEKIGLLTLYARVDSRNLPSISLFSKDADESCEEGSVAIFKYLL